MVGPNVVGKEEIPYFVQTTDSPFIIEHLDDDRVHVLVDSLKMYKNKIEKRRKQRKRK